MRFLISQKFQIRETVSKNGLTEKGVKIERVYEKGVYLGLPTRRLGRRIFERVYSVKSILIYDVLVRTTIHVSETRSN